VIDGPVSTNGQAAPCWFAATGDGRFAYAADAGSGTISGYSIHDGNLALLDPSGISANLGARSHPLDEAIGGAGGRFFYVLADGVHSLQTFRIGRDGSLTFVSANAGLPVGDAGLATA
jgi:6-phosphogluconolactonase